MSDSDFAAQYRNLLESLDGAIALLRTYRRNHWADWLERDRNWITAGDAYGLGHLLSAFGGMGSLNDVVISPLNGDDIGDADVGPVNERLADLRHQMWAAATWLKRDFTRP